MIEWKLPKLEPMEKFHSFSMDTKGVPYACITVHVRENLPQDGYWVGHTRQIVRPFEIAK